MTEGLEKLLTVREVSSHLRVDDTTVRRWIKSGSLEAVTLPHRGKRQAYRVKESTLQALLKGNASLPHEIKVAVPLEEERKTTWQPLARPNLYTR